MATQGQNRIDWKKVYFFIGDERYVPSNHENNNGLMAKKIILDPLGIKEDQIFYVDTSLPPKKAAKEYKEQLRSILAVKK